MSNNSSQSDSVYLRFNELEKKIAIQADEIVCLKSTLADVLRRLTQLEGRGKYEPVFSLLTRIHLFALTAIVTTTQYPAPTSHVKNGYHARTLIKNLTPKVYISNGNRRSSQYSSSTSLQADTIDSGLHSPAQSPQPSANYRSIPQKTLSMTRMSSPNNTNLKSMKRWSASQDIRQATAENTRLVYIVMHSSCLICL